MLWETRICGVLYYRGSGQLFPLNLGLARHMQQPGWIYIHYCFTFCILEGRNICVSNRQARIIILFGRSSHLLIYVTSILWQSFLLFKKKKNKPNTVQPFHLKSNCTCAFVKPFTNRVLTASCPSDFVIFSHFLYCD